MTIVPAGSAAVDCADGGRGGRGCAGGGGRQRVGGRRPAAAGQQQTAWQSGTCARARKRATTPFVATHPVGPGHRVVDAEDGEERAAEDDAGEQQVAHPLGALHLAVVGGRGVSRDARGEGVQHDERREHGAAVVGVEGAHQRQREHAEGERQQLQARPHQRAEEGAAGGEAEDVAVHELPPALLAVLGLLVVGRVLDKVVLEHAHEDGGQEAGEQEDGDAGVDDGEPVDLQVLLEELVLAVLVHAPLKGHRRRLPGHRVGELRRHLVAPALGDVHHLGGVGGDVDLHHAVLVVGDVEVEVREEEELLRVAVARGHGVHLAHVPPDGEVVVDKLEVVVLAHSLAEGRQLVARQRLLAERAALAVGAEGELVLGGHHAVAVHHLRGEGAAGAAGGEAGGRAGAAGGRAWRRAACGGAHLAQRQQLVVLLRGLAEGQVVVLIRLRGAREGADCSAAQGAASGVGCRRYRARGGDMASRGRAAGGGGSPLFAHNTIFSFSLNLCLAARAGDAASSATASTATRIAFMLSSHRITTARWGCADAIDTPAPCRAPACAVAAARPGGLFVLCPHPRMRRARGVRRAAGRVPTVCSLAANRRQRAAVIRLQMPNCTASGERICSQARPQTARLVFTRL